MSKLAHDKKRGRQSHDGVIGIDEVGRGPLAGPVTVCAFYIESKKAEKTLKKDIFNHTIKDSKKLRKLNRNNIYNTIRKNRKLNKNVLYTVSSRSAAYIDRHGISQALRSCVSSCITSLTKQGVDIYKTQINLDAGLVVPMEGLKQESFIKGDERFVEIAMASIVAKVTRDNHMERLAKVYKVYSWEKNMGYGTLQHRKAIEIQGVTRYHRMSYLKGFKLLDKTD